MKIDRRYLAIFGGLSLVVLVSLIVDSKKPDDLPSKQATPTFEKDILQKTEDSNNTDKNTARIHIEQDAAITFIKREAANDYFKRLGGTVKFDYKKPGRPVIGLSLSNTNVTDDGLVLLRGSTELQELDLYGTKITDAGLVHLKGLTKLQKLNLRETKVTDAGLVHLKGLTELQKLSLSFTKVTDAGLVHLKGLTKLQQLGLASTYVTQVGIEKLRKSLPDCHISRRLSSRPPPF